MSEIERAWWRLMVARIGVVLYYPVWRWRRRRVWWLRPSPRQFGHAVMVGVHVVGLALFSLMVFRLAGSWGFGASALSCFVLEWRLKHV